MRRLLTGRILRGALAIQPSPDHGIRPSLSVDVETEMPGDFFTQMRAVFTLQRMQRLARERAGKKNLPPLLTAREVVEFATVEGAKGNRLKRKAGTLTSGKQADTIMLRTDQIPDRSETQPARRGQRDGRRLWT